MKTQITLGKRLLAARKKKGYGLREFAGLLGISPSYLSDIENDRRSPGPDKLDNMAKLLGLGRQELVDLDTRIDREIKDIVRSEPGAGLLLRKIKQHPELLQELIEVAKKKGK